MKKWRLLVPVILVITALIVFLPDYGGAAKRAVSDEVMDLTAQIHTLNLVNHLYLDKSQLQNLLAVSREAKSLEESYTLNLESLQAPYTDALRGLKDELLVRSDPRKEVEDSFHKTKGKVESLLESSEKSRKDLVAKARSKLTDNQMIIISEYKACLVPVKSLTNPARIGQASDHSFAQKLLDRAREVPEGQLDKIFDKHAKRLREKLAKKMEESEIDSFLNKVRQTMSEARSLSKADYELKKPELVKKISPPDNPPREGKALDNAIARFLINPQGIPILEQKLSVAK